MSDVEIARQRVDCLKPEDNSRDCLALQYFIAEFVEELLPWVGDGEMPDDISPDTAFALGHLVGALEHVRALLGRDLIAMRDKDQ